MALAELARSAIALLSVPTGVIIGRNALVARRRWSRPCTERRCRGYWDRSVPAAQSSLEQQYVSVIARVAPEVVQISTQQGLGSGVVFDKGGDMVTNAHVVAGGGWLQVTDSRGRRYAASLVGVFTPDDLAVVRAQGSLSPASFADSSTLKVGEIVLAIGNPLGLRSSVTNGIISALGRTVSEPNGAVLPNVIQTSAPISPGNSGGALVDLRGKVLASRHWPPQTRW
jgi:putative serine protease PepD